jgi:hypothetical protein
MAPDNQPSWYAEITARSKSLRYESGSESDRYPKMIAPMVATAVTKKAAKALEEKNVSIHAITESLQTYSVANDIFVSNNPDALSR